MTKTALLFPGQGSQEKGMGRDVAEASSEALDLWKYAEQESGMPLREIYWDGEDSDMANTRALQPALTVVNLTLWQACASSLEPLAAAGHSLGEFAALAAAGVLSVRDAIRAVAIRGKLMADAGREGHGMAAVLKLEQDAVAEIVDKAAQGTGMELRIANYNTPGQFVISGEEAALDAAAGLAKESKGRCIKLPVSGAFHSPLISEAAEEFAKLLKQLEWNAPSFPVYFNATGIPEQDPNAIAELMQKQMTSSVLWVQTLASMWNSGIRTYTEIGPKGVLQKMLKPNFKGKEEDWTGAAIGSLADL